MRVMHADADIIDGSNVKHISARRMMNHSRKSPSTSFFEVWLSDMPMCSAAVSIVENPCDLANFRTRAESDRTTLTLRFCLAYIK